MRPLFKGRTYPCSRSKSALQRHCIQFVKTSTLNSSVVLGCLLLDVLLALYLSLQKFDSQALALMSKTEDLYIHLKDWNCVSPLN